MSELEQEDYDLRFEWGLNGVLTHAKQADTVVIVDTLSFCTAVDVAVSRGAVVYPYRVKDKTAENYAQQKKATLAVSRSKVTASNPYSLSPASYRNTENGERIVIPSPNGATLVLAAAEYCPNVIAGCIRNASAVANKAAELGQTIAIIAAGERWQDESLRPAVEDMIGAGAILAAIKNRTPSPEVQLAINAFEGNKHNIQQVLQECVSGRELVKRGYIDDVFIASELDVSQSVPIHTDGVLQASLM